MNSKIKTLALIATVFLTFSCVDLNQEPQSFLTEEQYIQLPQTIEIVNKFNLKMNQNKKLFEINI